MKENRGFSIKSKPCEWMGNIKPNISMYITEPQEKWGNFLEKYTLVFQFVVFKYFISVMVSSLEKWIKLSSHFLRLDRWGEFSWTWRLNLWKKAQIYTKKISIADVTAFIKPSSAYHKQIKIMVKMKVLINNYWNVKIRY